MARAPDLEEDQKNPMEVGNHLPQPMTHFRTSILVKEDEMQATEGTSFVQVPTVLESQTKCYEQWLRS